MALKCISACDFANVKLMCIRPGAERRQEQSYGLFTAHDVVN